MKTATATRATAQRAACLERVLQAEAGSDKARYMRAERALYEHACDTARSCFAARDVSRAGWSVWATCDGAPRASDTREECSARRDVRDMRTALRRAESHDTDPARVGRRALFASARALAGLEAPRRKFAALRPVTLASCDRAGVSRDDVCASALWAPRLTVLWPRHGSRGAITELTAGELLDAAAGRLWSRAAELERLAACARDPACAATHERLASALRSAAQRWWSRRGMSLAAPQFVALARLERPCDVAHAREALCASRREAGESGADRGESERTALTLVHSWDARGHVRASRHVLRRCDGRRSSDPGAQTVLSAAAAAKIARRVADLDALDLGSLTARVRLPKKLRPGKGARARMEALALARAEARRALYARLAAERLAGHSALARAEAAQREDAARLAHARRANLMRAARSVATARLEALQRRLAARRALIARARWSMVPGATCVALRAGQGDASAYGVYKSQANDYGVTELVYAAPLPEVPSAAQRMRESERAWEPLTPESPVAEHHGVSCYATPVTRRVVPVRFDPSGYTRERDAWSAWCASQR